MTYADKTFTQAANPQSLSRLMQLPAEIRAMILAELLIGTHAIEQDPCLSAQLLQACQDLHQEGLPILYGSNTLCICVERPQFKLYQVLNILGIRVRLPPPHHKGYSSKCDLLQWACRHLNFGEGWSKLVQYYPAMKQFQYFQLTLNSHHADCMFVVCRLLRDMLLDKNFHLVPSSEDEWNLDKRQVIQSCRFLKCRTLQVDGWEGKDIDDLAHTATTGPPVEDTWLLWKEFDASVAKLTYHKGESSSFMDEYRDEIWALQEHAMAYDLEAFEKLRATLVRKAIAWNEEYVLAGQTDLTKYADRNDQHAKERNESLLLSLQGRSR